MPRSRGIPRGREPRMPLARGVSRRRGAGCLKLVARPGGEGRRPRTRGAQGGGSRECLWLEEFLGGGGRSAWG